MTASGVDESTPLVSNAAEEDPQRDFPPLDERRESTILESVVENIVETVEEVKEKVEEVVEKVEEVVEEIKEAVEVVTEEVVEIIQEPVALPVAPREPGDHDRKLTAVQLAVLVFYKVSGGPFGCEVTVASAGSRYALLGFVLFPLLWCVPEALITAELGSAFPEPSGRTYCWFSCWLCFCFRFNHSKCYLSLHLQPWRG